MMEQTPASRSPRSELMWRSSLDRHVYPLMGNHQGDSQPPSQAD